MVFTVLQCADDGSLSVSSEMAERVRKYVDEVSTNHLVDTEDIVCPVGHDATAIHLNKAVWNARLRRPHARGFDPVLFTCDTCQLSYKLFEIVRASMHHAEARLGHPVPVRGRDAGELSFEQFEQFRMNAHPDFTAAGMAAVQALALNSNLHGALHVFGTILCVPCACHLSAMFHGCAVDPAHRDTCTKNKDNGECRFHHPQEPCERTSVSLHEVDGEQALRLVLQRNVLEVYMTSYNRWIMMAIPGNNNVRAVVDPSCTFYVTGTVLWIRTVSAASCP